VTGTDHSFTVAGAFRFTGVARFRGGWFPGGPADPWGAGSPSVGPVV